MKYALRTVVWHFKETTEELPELKSIRNVIVRGPEDIYRLYQPLFADQVRERFITFWLSAKNAISGFEVVSEGTLNGSLVHPREVFHGAITARAASIIIAHNHPSGNTEPSAEDIEITRQIKDAGRILGIPLHDHLIITGEGFTSLAERGIL
jgi:DNA repair protein RadC